MLYIVNINIDLIIVCHAISYKMKQSRKASKYVTNFLKEFGLLPLPEEAHKSLK